MSEEKNKPDVIEIKLPKFKFSGSATSKLRKNPWVVSTIILLILTIVLLINGSGNGEVISKDEAGKIVLELAKAQASDVELVGVNKESGLYEVVLLIEGEQVSVYITKDGKNLVVGLTPIPLVVDKGSGDGGLVQGSTFTDTGDEICKDQDGKPYVLLFSTTWCPHCEWIKDTFESLAQEDFADQISLRHWEIDTGDDALTNQVETEVSKDMLDIYEKYNPQGSIPTFVFGCKYIRIGNGYESQDDLDAEMQDFKLIINKLLA